MSNVVTIILSDTFFQSHSNTGLSLLLAWNPHDGYARSGCDFAKEPGKVCRCHCTACHTKISMVTKCRPDMIRVALKGTNFVKREPTRLSSVNKTPVGPSVANSIFIRPLSHSLFREEEGV